MKNKKAVYYLLMFLPLIITVIILPFLPEQIPAHYNFAGEIDRWGSKYESLIFPATTIAMGFFMLFMARIAAKDEDGGKRNEKIVLYTGMGISVWFTAMHCISIYKAFAAAECMSFSADADINQLFCIILGIGLVIIGNFMPKLGSNSLIGLRTPWSMKNDITWRKCQVFGGVSLMICGVLTVAAGIFAAGPAAMIIALGLLITDSIICVLYSYIIAKKY